MLLCGQLIELVDWSTPVLSPCVRPVKFLEYLFNDLFPELEAVMIGTSHASEHSELIAMKLTKLDVGSVAEELKTFGKECK